MKNLIGILGLVLGSLLFYACEKPQPAAPEQEKPDGPGSPDIQQADFLLEVSEITPVSCHFKVVPADNDMTYVVMLVEKSEFDSYEDEYKYQDDDLTWFEMKAMEEEKTLELWLMDFLKKGTFEADEAGLMPGESYYLYAYGLDYEGYFTSGVTKMEFSTPEIQMNDLSFDINVTDIGLTSAKVNVQASDDKAIFFMNVFSREQYEEWGGGEIAFSNHAQALVDYYVTMGKTPEDMVINLGSVGKGELLFDDLIDNTEYIAYAVGIDENFFVNSKATTVTFRTRKPVESSITFDIDIQSATYCSVIGTVAPSNSDKYICQCYHLNQVIHCMKYINQD